MGPPVVEVDFTSLGKKKKEEEEMKKEGGNGAEE